MSGAVDGTVGVGDGERDAGSVAGDLVGRFFDGVTAAPQEVTVTCEGDMVVARRTAGYGDQVLRWPRGRVARAPLDDARVTLTCAENADALLEMATEAADQLLGAASRAGASTGAGKGQPRWPVIAAYAAACALVATGLYLGVTPLSRVLARRVPPAMEAQLGQGLATLLGKQYCETAQDRASLETLARRLGGDGPLALHVLDTPMVNAFTLPGGTVIVTRGLLAEAEGPDELAGVLAHELEHVARRHVMVHVVRSSLLTALWQAAVGDYSGLMIVDPKTALDLAGLRFSRDDEREADRGALQRLGAAGIPRDGFRRFFDRMRAKTDVVPAWLSNHPSSAERIATIGAAPSGAAGAAPAAVPALAPAAWKMLHDACGGGAPAAGTSGAKPGR